MNNHYLDEEIAHLRKKYEEQLHQDEDLRYLTLSNLRYLEGREEYKKGNFHVAVNTFKDSLTSIIENLKIVSKFNNQEREQIIEKTKGFLSESARYYVSAYILDKNLGRDISDIRKLKQALIKEGVLNHKGFRLGREVIALAIEEGILLTIIKHPESLSEIANVDNLFDEDNFQKMPRERKLAFKKGQLIKNLKNIEKGSYITPVEVASDLVKYNLAVAKIIKEEDNPEDTAHYFEHMIAYRKYSCLTVKDADRFWDKYDELQKELDEFIKFDNESNYSIRTSHFATALVLIHAMGIAKSIKEKEEIARQITICYIYLKSYNSERFRVYWDWFKVANTILDTENVNKKKISEQYNSILKLKSLDYTDRDPEFIAKNLPGIEAVHGNLLNIRGFFEALCIIDSQALINDGSLTAALTLYHEDWLDVTSVYAILKKFIEKEIKINISPKPLRFVPEVEEESTKYLGIITAGETNEAEFKESWRYDTRTKEVNKGLENNALRAIASFMNSSGGYLFIGINDSGEIIGLEQTDYKLLSSKGSKNSSDILKRQIDDAVATNIGAAYFSLVDVSFDNDHGRTFCILKIGRSKSPVFLGDKFYIRASASSRELVGNSILEYYKDRFSNSEKTAKSNRSN